MTMIRSILRASLLAGLLSGCAHDPQPPLGTPQPTAAGPTAEAAGSGAPAPAGLPEPDPPAAPQPGTVLLVPLRSFPTDLLDAVEEGLQEVFQVEVRRLEPQPLPQEAWYPPRKRYRADRLLEHLHQFREGEPSSTRVLGLTEVDISVTKDEHPDWGVFGYGELPGHTALVSSHRLRGGLRDRDHLRRRVRIVGTHEVGHNLGLAHCTEARCLMQDAEGSIARTDSASGKLGAGCRSWLERLPAWGF